MFEFEFWFGSGWFSRKVGSGRGVRWMFAFGVLGNDAILEQLAWFRDMACSRTDCSERFWCERSDWASDLIGVRLGVVKFEICGVEVRVGLEESRRIMASGFIILNKPLTFQKIFMVFKLPGLFEMIDMNFSISTSLDFYIFDISIPIEIIFSIIDQL